MSVPFIPFAEGEAKLDWLGLTEALAAGHQLPKAEIGDTFLYRDPDTLLSRAAWIDGMGALVKTATVFPGNTDAPMINGGVNLYSDGNGTLEAIVDFHLVTKWKTAGDSLLGALWLATASDRILIVGAGTVGASVRAAEQDHKGLIDGIGHLRAVMRERFGEKVHLKPVDGARPWWRRRLGLTQAPGSADGAWAAGLLAAAEERAWWSRYGL